MVYFDADYHNERLPAFNKSKDFRLKKMFHCDTFKPYLHKYEIINEYMLCKGEQNVIHKFYTNISWNSRKHLMNMFI